MTAVDRDGPHTTERLAAWALADHAIYRSELALRQAKLLVLDTVGCAFAALDAGAATDVLSVTRQLGGQGEATLIGSPGKISAFNAILANGALVRVLDLNDVMFTQRHEKLSVSGHRSDNIPVALAAAEAYGGHGRDVLEAVILNYELYGRLRDLMPNGSPWDGASASGIVAAAMTGRLMRLDAAQVAHAIALAAARTATPKIVRNGNISATKSLANAFAAQAGFHSVLLAAAGVTGPLEILDDRKAGLYQVFDPDLGMDGLWAPFPDVPQILSAHIKSFPSIGTSQTAIEAALDLRRQIESRSSEIATLEVTMADVPAVRHQQQDPARRLPKSREAADHSFAYLIAAAVLDGELTYRQFENERWLSDAALLALMGKMSFRVSQPLADRAAGSMPCQLRATLRDGSVYQCECLYPRGHSFAEKGLDASVVEEKFLAMSGGLPPARAMQIQSDIMALEQPGRFGSLLRGLSGEQAADNEA